MAGHSNEMDMTEGNIRVQLLRLTVPVLLSQILQQLYNVADTSIIGHYTGSAGLAASGSAGLLLSVMVNFFVGLSAGVSVVISQLYGAGRYEQLRRGIHTAVTAAAVLGAVFQLAGLLGTDYVLLWLGTPADAAELGRIYLRICFWGMIPQLVYNVGTAVLNAIGDTRTPLYFLTASAVLHIALDYLFVAVWGLDIGGAAAATLIAQVLSMVLILRKLMTLEPRFRFRFRQMGMDRRHLGQLASAGIPGGLQALFMSFSSLVIQTSINSFGTEAVAGMTVFSRVEGFLYLPLFSLGIAVTSFIGQNAGAGRYDRIRQGTRISMAVSLILWALFCGALMAAAPVLVRLFTTDQAVMDYGIQAIWYVFPSYAFYGVNQIYIGVLRGMGKTVRTMAVTICCYAVFRVAWCRLILPLWNDMRVIYLSYSVSIVLMTLLLYLCSRRLFASFPDSVKM